jgi:hypothetical protein
VKQRYMHRGQSNSEVRLATTIWHSKFIAQNIFLDFFFFCDLFWNTRSIGDHTASNDRTKEEMERIWTKGALA